MQKITYECKFQLTPDSEVHTLTFNWKLTLNAALSKFTSMILRQYKDYYTLEINKVA